MFSSQKAYPFTGVHTSCIYLSALHRCYLHVKSYFIHTNVSRSSQSVSTSLLPQTNTLRWDPTNRYLCVSLINADQTHVERKNFLKYPYLCSCVTAVLSCHCLLKQQDEILTFTGFTNNTMPDHSPVPVKFWKKKKSALDTAWLTFTLLLNKPEWGFRKSYFPWAAQTTPFIFFPPRFTDTAERLTHPPPSYFTSRH